VGPAEVAPALEFLNCTNRGVALMVNVVVIPLSILIPISIYLSSLSSSLLSSFLPIVEALLRHAPVFAELTPQT